MSGCISKQEIKFPAVNGLHPTFFSKSPSKFCWPRAMNEMLVELIEVVEAVHGYGKAY